MLEGHVIRCSNKCFTKTEVERGTYGGHVVRCSNKCFSKTEVVVEDSSQAKVSQLHIVTAVKKYVSWFQITMKNLGTERRREKGGGRRESSVV